jgi:processing peptidase subunit beta
MRSLAALVKDQAPAFVRAYAGAVAPVASSPFLRFSNPYPTPVDTTPLLSTIPETNVSLWCQQQFLGLHTLI